MKNTFKSNDINKHSNKIIISKEQTDKFNEALINILG